MQIAQTEARAVNHPTKIHFCGDPESTASRSLRKGQKYKYKMEKWLQIEATFLPSINNQFLSVLRYFHR